METKRYRIWIEVEEESTVDGLTTLEEYTESVGGDFDTLEKALEARRKLVELL